ncbi:MAG: RNA ligase [Candidatus Woesearchaeota archaeon]
MLNVQKYLLENGLQSLKDNYGVITKEYDNFVVLNYSQTDSPKNNPITDECRGLILTANFKKVLCRSFDRFYNLGEADQKIDNIDDYTILEKYDGSLINIWYNPFEDKFQASSRGTAYAESETQYGTKFIDIIRYQILGIEVDEFFENLNPYCTYIFELVGPENRVVKYYNEPKLVFIGMRDSIDGNFVTYDEMIYTHSFRFSHNPNVLLADKYEFSSINDIMENIKTLNATDEGYVLWNEKTGHRIKIKNPDYVHIHHIRDNGVLVPRRIVSLIHSNGHEEYLSYFPEDIQFFQPYIDAYNNFIKDINNVWDSVKHIEDQKEFALKVKDKPITPILFTLKKGFTIKDAFDKIQDKKLAEMVKKYKEENNE